MSDDDPGLPPPRRSDSDPREFLAAGLLGPTAVGKTAVALIVAECAHLEILSVDSRQIFRRLEIGTAKPTAAERARVPHHLLDVLEPTETCSAGRYRDLALEALRAAARRGVRLLGAGGAGLYWEALARGLHELPRASAEIRQRHARLLAEEGPGALHRRLREVDPPSAARLAPADVQRVSRALEVAELTGRPLSALLRGPRPDSRAIPVVALLRERADLYRRIEDRCVRLLDAGLVEELRALLATGVPPDAPGLRTVGYREFLPHLLEGKPLPLCVAEFVRASRRYAKRQETWLRHRIPEAIVVQVGAEETAEETAGRVEEALSRG
jgi:tRNA dimethylallyltransferase